jgi:hypothetical protein
MDRARQDRFPDLVYGDFETKSQLDLHSWPHASFLGQ